VSREGMNGRRPFYLLGRLSFDIDRSNAVKYRSGDLYPTHQPSNKPVTRQWATKEKSYQRELFDCGTAEILGHEI